jgi:hypothetical protein
MHQKKRKGVLARNAGSRGQVTMYVMFCIFATLIIIVMTLMFPLGVRINTQMYIAGDTIMRGTNDSLNLIQNTTVRDSIKSAISGALGNTEENIKVNAAFYKYSGYIMIGIIALTLFLIQRRLVEYQGGGGGYFS